MFERTRSGPPTKRGPQAMQESMVRRFKDVVDVERWFYITDDALGVEQLVGDRICSPSGRLIAREGALQVRSELDSGLAWVVIEVFDDALPPVADSSRAWGWSEQWAYPTRLGLQRVRSSELEEAQAGLARPVTGPGPATVHVRVHEQVGVQPDSEDGEPVDALYLVHLWSGPTRH